LVRLVAEVAPLRTDHASAKRFLLNGFAKMIEADGWTATHLARRSPREPMQVMHVQEGTPSESSERVGDRGPVERISFLNSGCAYEHDWLAGAAISSRECAFPHIVTMQPFDADRISVIGVFRQAGRPEFTARERALATLLFSEVRWLHAVDWKTPPTDAMPRLSPRQKMVLELLRAGVSRKIIADQLGISVHTVSGYAKEVYAVFRVRSQAELIRHCGSNHGVPRVSIPRSCSPENRILSLGQT